MNKIGKTIRVIVTIFFAISALFWALFPHSVHCSVLKNIGITECPSHIIHVLLGLFLFVIAIVARQGNLFNPKNWD